MPRVRWGIDASVIDNFDRSTQYAPYTGPAIVNGVYKFRIKRVKYVAATREKLPSLHVGLELVPRSRDEKRFSSFYITAFLNVGDKNAFTYVPFCDAIGVSGSDFTDRMIADQEGNVKRIGRWRMTGNEEILAKVNDGEYNGKARKEIDWMGPLPDNEEGDDFDEDDSDDEEYDGDDEEFDFEDEEPEPPKPTRSVRSGRTTARTSKDAPARRRRSRDEDEPF